MYGAFGKKESQAARSGRSATSPSPPFRAGGGERERDGYPGEEEVPEEEALRPGPRDEVDRPDEGDRGQAGERRGCQRGELEAAAAHRSQGSERGGLLRSLL